MSQSSQEGQNGQNDLNDQSTQSITGATSETPSRDSSLDLLVDGYGFADGVRRRAGAEGAKAAKLRLMGQPAMLIRGEEAVETFYDTDRFERAGAMPAFIKQPLFGSGAVHGLDGDEHRHRKSLFVTATHPSRVSALVQAADRRWAQVLDRRQTIDVYEAAVQVFGRAVLPWAGVDVPRDELPRRARQLAEIVDGFGRPVLPWVRAMAARRSTDAWASGLIEGARERMATAGDGYGAHARPDASGEHAESVLRLVASHRGLDGELLDVRTAGVELQNVLRPTIAVSRFAAFVALALHEHPEWIERLRAEAQAPDASSEAAVRLGAGVVGATGPLALAFAHEVRRLSPFVPMLPAIAKCPVHFGGESVDEGERVLIDIWGTNTDAAHWERPKEFDPERFLDADPFEIGHLVPQGGGEVETGHRCPGEGITIGLMAVTAARLASVDWSVDADGLDVDMTRLPTRPSGGPTLTLAH